MMGPRKPIAQRCALGAGADGPAKAAALCYDSAMSCFSLLLPLASALPGRRCSPAPRFPHPGGGVQLRRPPPDSPAQRERPAPAAQSAAAHPDGPRWRRGSWSLPAKPCRALRAAPGDCRQGDGQRSRGGRAPRHRRLGADGAAVAQAPLPAGTQYEVQVIKDKQRAKLESLRPARSKITARRRLTGQGSQYTPPVVPPPDGGLCDSGRELIELKVAPPRDDQAGSALYLLWLAKDGTPIDFAAPPSHAQVMRPTDRTLPDRKPLQMQRGGALWAARPWQTEQRVGLVVYDEAGNASRPVERVIPLGAAAGR